MSIKVAIADDHAVLRQGLRLMIEQQADMSVVAEAVDGTSVLAACTAWHPDVVVLDLTMPNTDGFATIAAICGLGSRVVVLTMHADASYLDSAFRAGALGYVVKTAAHTELLAAIRAVANGCEYVDASHGPRGLDGTALSPRERQTLQLLGRGLTNQKVAEVLGVSLKTAETYRARLREKLGLRTREDIVRYAVDAGILTPAAAPAGRSPNE